jgi:hypothetical protein
MLNFIEARGNIALDCPSEPQLGVRRPTAQCKRRVMGKSQRAKSPRTRIKHAFLEGFQDHLDRGLHHTVLAGGNT